MVFSIDFYSLKRNTFNLKCFIQFTCTSLDACQKENCNFLNLLQKGGTQKGGRGEGGGPLEKGGRGVSKQTWRKLWIKVTIIEEVITRC